MNINKLSLYDDNEYDIHDGSIFVGTKEEWEALESDDKNKYRLVNITNDGETGTVVDNIEAENMNPVSSDAVYRKFAEKFFNLNSTIANIKITNGGVNNNIQREIKYNLCTVLFIGRSSWSAVYFASFEGSVLLLSSKGTVPSTLSVIVRNRTLIINNSDTTAHHYIVLVA